MSKTLSSSSHVFIRNDLIKKPLQQPYIGTYKVLNRSEKYYTLDINGKHNTVSIDHLSNYYSILHILTQSQQVTRSGRRALATTIRWLRSLLVISPLEGE